MRDLFPDSERPTSPGPYPATTIRRREVATYDYKDENGDVLFQVVRYDPKGFAQRRPDPERPGKWCWGLANARRVLYQLPALLARPREGVLIVEGEKDADALASLKLLATTCPGGVGMGWRDEYSACLKGRRLVVIPDNDFTGREHGDYVAGSLIRHGVESVRYLLLPGLSDKGDVSDWLKMGGTKEELIRLIRLAPEWRQG
jgi:hypothetical protein